MSSSITRQVLLHNMKRLLGGWVVLTFECRSLFRVCQRTYREVNLFNHIERLFKKESYVEDCILFHYEHAFSLVSRCDFAVLYMSHVATVAALALDNDIYTF